MDIHLLDMGTQIYGDSIVIVDGETKILIDGAHMYDDRPKDGHRALQDQIGDVLGLTAPFEFDLLVVTHCHSDHIGCLPTLVKNGVITAKWALLADPDLGYPTGPATDRLDEVAAKVVAGLREEPVGEFGTDAELDAFLTDAMNLQARYRAMISQLNDAGTKVVLFGGVDATRELRALTRAFKSLNLQIIGPTASHLKICADALRDFSHAAASAASGGSSSDSGNSAVDIYRTLAGTRPASTMASDDILRFLDRPGQGAALNDQSIVLTVGDGDNVCLLTGDMQFAKAEIAGLEQEMLQLLGKTAQAGPYAFVKLPHHASYNGFDDDVLAAWNTTRVLGISTGQGDPAHPDPGVLALLRTLKGHQRWVRTDKNGQVSLRIEGGNVQSRLSRGRLDDASPNTSDAPKAAVAPAPSPSGPSGQPVVTVTPGAAEMVEITARIPHVATRVTISVDIQPGGAGTTTSGDRTTSGPFGPHGGAVSAGGIGTVLGGGRVLPPLLFVTNRGRLGGNIGQDKAAAALAMIKAAGQAVLDVRAPDVPFDEVAAELSRLHPQGVVILGGYDVLPPVRYGVIPDSLRQRLSSDADPDGFVVWSDQRYGDKDGDGLGELPVSRIPDGKSADLVITALGAGTLQPAAPWFGLRNVARPFADSVFVGAGGPAGGIKVSEPTLARSLGHAPLDARSIYIMLHGSDDNATCYWGERVQGGTVEAVRLPNVPDPCGGIVFAGCCWGALAARDTAIAHNPQTPHQPLTPDQSIALSFLLRGANAFVGCTGAHYSPVSDNPADGLDYFGAPMHKAFWAHHVAGAPPAEALFKAKMDYISAMPHGRTSPEEQAIEYKILREFTCLGLGW